MNLDLLSMNFMSRDGLIRGDVYLILCLASAKPFFGKPLDRKSEVNLSMNLNEKSP